MSESAGGTPYPRGPVEVALLDRSGVIVSVNDAWDDFCRENGGDPGACGVGIDFLAICDRALGDPVSARVAAATRGVLAGDLPAPVTHVVPCDSPGEVRWFELVVGPRAADDGTLLGATVSLYRTAAPPPLLDRTGVPSPLVGASISWQLLEDSPDGALLVDAEGTIHYANRRMEDISGYDRAELLGQRVELLLPANDSGRHASLRDDLDLMDGARAMGVDNEALTVCRADGGLVPVEVVLTPVHFGGPVVTLAFVRDVSARRAGARARHRLLMLLDLIPDAVYAVGAAGRIEYANSAASAMLGYSKQELRSLTLEGVSVTSDDPVAESLWEEHLRRGPHHVHHRQVVRRRRDGTEIPCDSRGQLVRLEDGDTFIVVDRDARDALAAEVQAARQSSLTILVSLVTQLVLSDAEPDDIYQWTVEGVAGLMRADGVRLDMLGPDADQTVTLGAVGLLPDEDTALDATTLAEWSQRAAPFPIDGAHAVGGDTGGAAWRGLAAPLGSATPTQGVLTAFRAGERGPFTPDDTALLGALARQLATLLELDRARRGQQRLALLEERQRIARDLHDLVIQDLISLGMRLDSLSRRGAEQGWAAGDSELVDELVERVESVVRTLRQIVFDSRSPEPHSSVREGVLATVAEAERNLGHPLTLVTSGPVDQLPDKVADHLLLALREGLSNVARHAGATETTVDHKVSGKTVTLVVDDNGRGLDEGRVAGTGLANLRERARLVGGASEVGPRPGGGTRLRWSAQIPS
jgi:PAS domain S-box-containing protein